MIGESPTRISAWRILPSSSVDRNSSVAPNAFWYHSIAGAASLKIRYGVAVWNPSGTRFTGFVITRPPG
jgi:hypothetical protein